MSVMFDDFIAQVRLDCSRKTPGRSDLQRMGEELQALCATSDFDAEHYRPARPGESLLYELNVDPAAGASLYLVSDGAGVDTVAHEHQTWAIIVGIKGAEFTVFYEAADKTRRLVSRLKECLVGEGDVLVMGVDEIHAIDSRRGTHPTCHVHLYGRSLASLPSFSTRCYTAIK